MIRKFKRDKLRKQVGNRNMTSSWPIASLSDQVEVELNNEDKGPIASGVLATPANSATWPTVLEEESPVLAPKMLRFLEAFR